MISIRVRAALAVVLTAALLSIALLFACIVSAQSDPVQLTITPDTLALSPGENATVLVLASTSTSNTDSLRPTTITLTSFTSTGVDSHLLADDKRQASPPGGAVPWLMEIAAPASGVSPGTLYLTAIYELGKAGSETITRTTTATLKITGRPAEAITDVLSVTLHSDIATLLDLRRRKAILVLTNIGDVPLTIMNVVPTLTSTKEEQLKAVAMTSTLPVTLLPQRATEIPVTLSVGSSIEAGENLLVVRVDADWMRGTLVKQGSTVVTTTFKSGVFAEDTILKALGIPALLLLPGLLMMVGFSVLSRLFRPSRAGTAEPDWWSLNWEAKWTKPSMLFWAISFSLALFLVYPWISGPYLSWVTGEKQTGRNLLTGYGFIDIVYLWFLAVAAGFIFAVIAAWATPAAKLLQRKWLERFTPTDRDNEETVLEKLVRNRNKNFEVETRKYTGEKYQDEIVWMLPERIHAQEQVWVTPRIEVKRGPKFPTKSAEEFNKEFDGVVQDIQNGKSKDGLKQLREWLKMGVVALAFAQGKMKRPTLVKETDLEETAQGRQPILDTMIILG